MTDIPQRVIADPTTHYGPGKPETRNFRLQRITAAINVVLLLVLVWFVLGSARADHATMTGMMRNPLVALLLAVMVVNVPLHMRIGMREIIEDYVHQPRLNRFCLMVNSYFAIVIGLVGLGAVAKVFFWG